MKAYTYDNFKRYSGETSCQIDPLESKMQGKEIYLLPADSTFKEPLPEKDGFFVVFNGDDWEYQEKPKPSEEDIKNQRIAELKCFLEDTDYKAIKYAEGWYSDEEYAPFKEQREAWREEIRELEDAKKENNVNNNSDGG